MLQPSDFPDVRHGSDATRVVNERENSQMPKTILAVLALLALAACNTMEGAGRDISTAGDAITDEAQDAQ